MSAVLAVLGFAALFAAFGLLAPVLRRKRCAGGDGTGCAGCGAGACEFKGGAE